MRFDAEAAARLAVGVRRSTVEVAVRERGGGCGIVWDKNGIVVTNAHVVGSARRAQVKLQDGESLEGEVVSRDERRDLAEVRVESAPSLEPAAIGDAAALRVGDIVAAFGAPFGIAGALTLGIVHRKPVDGDGELRRWVEADVRLAPGNSGGPLVDARGRVVGVNSMIAYGLALAVPSETVARFLRSRGTRAWIGITADTVRFDGTHAGFCLLVCEIHDGGPAARAGIVAGDVIVGVDGRRFRRPGEFERELDKSSPGAKLTVDILRDGSVRAFVVEAGSFPAQSSRAA